MINELLFVYLLIKGIVKSLPIKGWLFGEMGRKTRQGSSFQKNSGCHKQNGPEGDRGAVNYKMSFSSIDMSR